MNRLGKAKIKNCRKEIRLSPEELEELRRKAEEQGLKESQYMRMLITNRPRDYPDLLEVMQSLTNEVNHIGININQITKNNNSGLYHESDKKRLYVYMKQIKEAVKQVVSLLESAGT
ncbi:MAG: plasmid mobilization relaxosome protein MobC [Hungatella hathewayi]|nr:plasmid mobilization relaxosome protein MobC [Hungatella hathewayi]